MWHDPVKNRPLTDEEYDGCHFRAPCLCGGEGMTNSTLTTPGLGKMYTSMTHPPSKTNHAMILNMLMVLREK
jgi:hypothetical protein